MSNLTLSNITSTLKNHIDTKESIIEDAFVVRDDYVIDENSPSVIVIVRPVNLTVKAGQPNTHWKKNIITYDCVCPTTWEGIWVDTHDIGSKDESTTNNRDTYLSTVEWLGDGGVCDNPLEYFAFKRKVKGTISTVNSEKNIIIKRDGQVIYDLPKGGQYNVELSRLDKIDGIIEVESEDNIVIKNKNVLHVYENFNLTLKTVTYTEENPLITEAGRKLWRHPSEMGTVIEFNDGQDRKVLVLDAQYRARWQMMTSTSNDTSLPNYISKNTNNTWYIDGGSSATTPSACASLTDDTLNSLWVNSIDDNTSKYNTDVWFTQPDCEAATHCRSITVNGVGCDIPNIQTLMRIYCEGVLLDALDPTVTSYQDFRFSDWFASWYLWSSTECNTQYVRQMHSNGSCGYDRKDSSFGVCPVFELRVPKNGTLTPLGKSLTYEDSNGNTVTLQQGVASSCELYVGCKIADKLVNLEGSGITIDENGYVTSVEEGFSATIVTEYSQEYPLVTTGGRKLWRHPSGMGTVMEFDDGQDRKVLVLDAQYRVNAKMTSSSTDTSLPNYNQSNSNGNWAINGTESIMTPSERASLTDATLNNLWAYSIDTNTSRYNTDFWLTQPDCNAATHCRSITVNEVGCDIPNIQTLMRIYCEGVLLDALDPTVASYPYMTLSEWFVSGLSKSSTERSDTNVRTIGIVKTSGYTTCGGSAKELSSYVCPVLEI